MGGMLEFGGSPDRGGVWVILLMGKCTVVDYRMGKCELPRFGVMVPMARWRWRWRWRWCSVPPIQMMRMIDRQLVVILVGKLNFIAICFYFFSFLYIQLIP